MAFKKIKKHIRRKRFGQWLRVNIRMCRRKVRRFFKNSAFRKVVLDRYGKPFVLALVAGILCSGCLIAGHIAARRNNEEGMLLDRLTYGEDYDSKVPYFRTLHAIGSSNHLCVTVETANVDNLKDPTVGLEQGGISLKVSFIDGTHTELPLQRHYRKNCFAPGAKSNFILTLPYGYTPFDISAVSLVLIPGVDGTYDDWLCVKANVSFMLGGERVLIAQSNWEQAKRFGSGKDLVRAADLTDARTDNTTYKQMELLFTKLLSLAEHGLKSFSDGKTKQEALASIGFSNANALYLDVETVSAERNAALKNQQGEKTTLPDEEDLNYNGVLKVTLSFNGALTDGGYSKEYLLDIPGKDDFEMSSASTFRMDLPSEMCVFDINEVTITTVDQEDAWAPRFARLYLTLDFDQELEIARLTDVALENQYDTPIFYRGFLDAPIPFDLSVPNAVPSHLAEMIETTYNQKFSKTGYTMYFDKQSFYSRQILFFEQMDRLLIPTQQEEEA